MIHPDLHRRARPTAGLHYRTPASRLEEACGLALAIDLEIAAAEVVRVSEPRPATLIGQGAVDRLKQLIEEQAVALVVVDAAISPVQQRNLEQAWKAKVIDRTGIILEIFGERARTKEGQLQVELAALSYQRSRLVRSWTHLERQRGGFGFIGGPGESQIEIDRRLIDERIVRIKRDLEDVKRTRALHRRARKRVPFPIVALVGYTNAGKSTLFNRLTQAEVVAKDLLFATLDPTMRRVRLPGGRDIILSDTVGFISDLPTELVAAFRATLEEVLEADLILHVRDIAHPESEAQKADVEAVLESLGLEHRVVHDMIEVLNKIDALPAEDAERIADIARRDRQVAAVSALTGAGCERLLEEIEARLARDRQVATYRLGHDRGGDIAWLYEHGEVLERHDDEQGASLKVRLSADDRRRFEQGRPAVQS
ncbi:MAG TPA: GTPase HflX [Dongiaceae bacterium]|nr:GTPase HflX [Dongiaceae bacterium]